MLTTSVLVLPYVKFLNSSLGGLTNVRKNGFFDTGTPHRVAVSQARHAEKIREMADSFEETEDALPLMTIHKTT